MPNGDIKAKSPPGIPDLHTTGSPEPEALPLTIVPDGDLEGKPALGI